MMSLPLNYFFEANLALCLFLVVYLLLLRKETSFTLKRMILLSGLLASVIFPIVHVDGSALSIPSFREVIATTLLPELVVMGHGKLEANTTPGSVWNTLNFIYIIGASAALVMFVLRIIKLLLTIRKSKTVAQGQLYVAESYQKNPPFSFFNYVFIGQAAELTQREKDQIIAHEAVHARQWHSLDILLLNIIGIFFWFNPVLKIYKNIFIQLHEFEADARSVKDEEMNDYCNLLARVALLSADIRIANHFSNSLTLKRIQMMRTSKLKIRTWKLAAMIMIIPAFFLLLSCQDQLMNDVTDLAKSSSVAIDMPEEVQKQFDQMKAAHPELQLVVMEIKDSELDKLEDVRKVVESKGTITSMNFITPTAKGSEPMRHFVIIEYNDQVASLAERSKENNVYTVVEESASPEGGIETFYGFLAKNISYPKDAREAGVQGKVFVSFIVEPDGSLSDLNVVKGVNELLDAEALRVVKLSPKWTPGKHEGVVVRQKMVLPINFAIEQKSEVKKVGLFSTPINPFEFLNPAKKKDDKC
jgi:TonB family protein